MKKVIYSFIFSFLRVLTLQAETMVVATYNLRNANGGDSTNGNGWGQRYPYIAPDRTISRVRYLWYPRGQISAIAGLEASHARI